MEKVEKLASENGVMMFVKSSCCLCYAVSILLREVGVKAYVHELDHDSDGKEMDKALIKMGCNPSVPALFIAGKLIGSTNEIMSLHLKGSLLQLLNPYII